MCCFLLFIYIDTLLICSKDDALFLQLCDGPVLFRFVCNRPFGAALLHTNGITTSSFLRCGRSVYFLLPIIILNHCRSPHYGHFDSNYDVM